MALTKIYKPRPRVDLSGGLPGTILFGGGLTFVVGGMLSSRVDDAPFLVLLGVVCVLIGALMFVASGTAAWCWWVITWCWWLITWRAHQLKTLRRARIPWHDFPAVRVVRLIRRPRERHGRGAQP